MALFQIEITPYFGFAGIYDVWKDRKTGKEIESYTIVTTEPNACVGTVHHRMPVILKREDEAAWLDPDVVEPERLLPLLAPYPADLMETWPVVTRRKTPGTTTMSFSSGYINP